MVDPGFYLAHIARPKHILLVAIINRQRAFSNKHDQIVFVVVSIEKLMRRVNTRFWFAKSFGFGIRSKFRFVHFNTLQTPCGNAFAVCRIMPASKTIAMT